MRTEKIVSLVVMLFIIVGAGFLIHSISFDENITVDILTVEEIVESPDCEDNRVLQLFDMEGRVTHQWPCCAVSAYEHIDDQMTIKVYRCGIGTAGKIVLNAGYGFYLHDREIPDTI